MPGPVLTIGYQGAEPAAFVATLAGHGVTLLVDVRHQPWSRRPEFTGRALTEAMAAAGIGYRHVPALGSPPALRDLARTGKAGAFADAFRAHLAGAPARDALDALAALHGAERLCLMCLERRPGDCHRRFVAAALAAHTGHGVQDLFVDPGPGPLFAGL